MNKAEEAGGVGGEYQQLSSGEKLLISVFVYFEGKVEEESMKIHENPMDKSVKIKKRT